MSQVLASLFGHSVARFDARFGVLFVFASRSTGRPLRLALRSEAVGRAPVRLDFTLKMMDFTLKMMDFTLKMMDFTLKMMDFTGGGCDIRTPQCGIFRSKKLLFY